MRTADDYIEKKEPLARRARTIVEKAHSIGQFFRDFSEAVTVDAHVTDEEAEPTLAQILWGDDVRPKTPLLHRFFWAVATRQIDSLPREMKKPGGVYPHFVHIETDDGGGRVIGSKTNILGHGKQVQVDFERGSFSGDVVAIDARRNTGSADLEGTKIAVDKTGFQVKEFNPLTVINTLRHAVRVARQDHQTVQ